MTKKGMKPNCKTLDKQPKTKRVEIARKGGQTVTQKQRMSQKLRWIKEKGYVTDKAQQWFIERITDPEADLFYMQEWLDKLRVSLPEDKQASLMNNALALHKAKFGEKHKNININIDVSPDDLLRRVGEVDSLITDIIN